MLHQQFQLPQENAGRPEKRGKPHPCSFCALLEPPSAPAKARKNNLPTSTTAQVEECPGEPASNPSTSWSTCQCGWRSSTLLSPNCWCTNADLISSCASKGLPDSSLIICTTAASSQFLQYSGHVKASSFELQGLVPTLFTSLPTLRPLAYHSFKRSAGTVLSPCCISAEMQALLCCHCLWGWKALYWYPEALSAIQAHRC